MSEMLKRVTDAVTACRIDSYGTDEDIARAAIEAIREPTGEMITAGWRYHYHYSAHVPNERHIIGQHQAMIDEALK